MLVGRVWIVNPINDNSPPPYTLSMLAWHRSNLDHVEVERKQGFEGCHTAENVTAIHTPSLGTY